MNSVIKALQQFLTRDLLYVLGGSSILLSIGWYFGLAVPEKSNNAILFFVIGIAYVIGYLIQELVSLTPILTTSHFEPNKFISWLYQKFTNHELVLSEKMTNNTAFVELYSQMEDRQIQQIERTITLKHIGSTIGSNWLISSIFIVLKAMETKENLHTFVAIAISSASVFLLILAWIKGAQQMQMFSEALESRYKPSTRNPPIPFKNRSIQTKSDTLQDSK